MEPIARLEGVSKNYGKVRALDGLDLEVRQGEVLAVLGPNGAGKTTAVGLMVGMFPPDSGRASLFGRAPDSSAARMRVGVMLQISGVSETLKVKEHIHLFSSYYPNPLPPAEVIAMAGLQGLEERYFAKLSGGQKQRLLFALAVCGRPDLVFLDEPTVGLDVEARRGFWQQVRAVVSSGRGVVLTTHYLEEADALADRIVVIDKGRVIAQGTPAEIKASVAGRRIRCQTVLLPEKLRALPCVSAVKQNGSSTEIFTSNAEQTLRRLLVDDPSLSDLEVTGAGLEEAFLDLTRGDMEVAV